MHMNNLMVASIGYRHWKQTQQSESKSRMRLFAFPSVNTLEKAMHPTIISPAELLNLGLATGLGEGKL